MSSYLLWKHKNSSFLWSSEVRIYRKAENTNRVLHVGLFLLSAETNSVNLNVQMFVVMLFLYLTSCVSCTDLRWQQPAALSLSLCFLFSVRCVSAAAARHSLCCWQKVGGWKDAEFLTAAVRHGASASSSGRRVPAHSALHRWVCKINFSLSFIQMLELKCDWRGPHWLV